MGSAKIDIVYLWVDGSDPVWQEKRNKAYQDIVDTSLLDQYANVDGRFRNNRELLYSLRSLDLYFPECGNIYIVTDCQIPDFLLENKKIHVIFHDTFMDTKQLPTFSSKNIESCLVDIPGLSEKFLYLNDDVFLGPQFSLDDFLSGDTPIFYFIENVIDPVGSALPSEKVLKKYYPDYMITSEFSAHSPKIISKRDFLDMKKEFSELFHIVGNEVFRTKDGISLLADFYPRWMVYHRRGLHRGEKGEYYRTTENCYEDILNNFSQSHFFCINDTHDNTIDENLFIQDIEASLDHIFVAPSSFEK